MGKDLHPQGLTSLAYLIVSYTKVGILIENCKFLVVKFLLTLAPLITYTFPISQYLNIVIINELTINSNVKNLLKDQRKGHGKKIRNSK